ncbi:MAG: hydroxyacid dehydrogenase [Pseudotabrizicola sp.]|uniref:hydroxyacid dehydrogenase n=1 Tax=Pseudotabrizicola sp. TaxID=2939647 RepID=UPI00272FF519|nr:hydroxyacid dehydrogenase [Pseudotabrizicola sp.]MDP2080604.1 hydroxyacid dehydrogenase [Pseudotabrizicola sp.]MDZ7573332.1 hydroxyacid dehydrogenase [Pseudotabrizicola sp.]
MQDVERPLVLCCPLPRTLELIFTPARLDDLRARYRLVETTDEALPGLDDAVLGAARYIIGQPPLDAELLARLTSLRCIFNVESNLINNMPYDLVFSRGIHVVTTGAVFAEPVAEIGLGFALSLLRNIHGADADFRAGREAWGGAGNGRARLLSGAEVGIIGFGDLGQAVARVLQGFRPRLRIHDPWLPDARILDAGAAPATLDSVMTQSDVVFVTAAVTSENRGFLGADAFGAMRKGAAFILLSRADVVEFPALMAAVASGHIRAASDVFPEEPLAADHPVRSLPGFLLSAHRAGALDVAFQRMGEMVWQDLALLEKGLPPNLCKRAERETVARMRSRPVTMN